MIEEVAAAARLRARARRQRQARIQVGGGDADIGAGPVQQRLGRADIGTPARQRRGQADRQGVGQPQFGKAEYRHGGGRRVGSRLSRLAVRPRFGRRSARRVARQFARRLGRRCRRQSQINRELMARRRQLPRQARQQCLGLRQFAALALRFDPRGPAQRDPLLDDRQLPPLCVDQRLGVLDLRAQAGLADGGGGDIGGERQPRGLQLEALEIHRRAQAFQFAPLRAEQVQHVRDPHRGAVQREGRGTGERGDAHRLDIDLLARGVEARVDGGPLRDAGRRRVVVLRALEAGLRLRQRRAVGERGADGAIERGAAEQRPPLRRHVRAIDQSLRVAVRHRRGGRRRRRGRCAVARAVRRGRCDEVRAGRAAGQQRGGSGQRRHPLASERGQGHRNLLAGIEVRRTRRSVVTVPSVVAFASAVTAALGSQPHRRHSRIGHHNLTGPQSSVRR
ncbi:hypothetical protein OJJOAM_001335 [Cupriavidus sp. H18C1]